MAGLRYQIDGFIPEDPNGVLVPSLGIKLPQTVVNHLPTLRDELRAIKSFTRKINEGYANEEATVRFTYHICKHDEANPQPCVEQEI